MSSGATEKSNTYKNIFTFLKEGFIVIDPQGRVDDMNPLAEELLKIKRDKVLGKLISGVVPGSPLTEVLEKGEETGPLLERRGGKVLLSHHFPLKESGELEGAFSIYQDITELDAHKLKLEDALQRERELEAILENSHDGIWIMDGAGITLQVSKSWENFSGIKREEMIGRSVYEIVSKGYYSDSAAIHVIAQREPVTIIYETKTKRKALVTATPVFDKNGNIWRIISNVRDITELDQYRRELQEIEGKNLRFHEELKHLKVKQLDHEGIVARSQSMREIFEVSAQTADSGATVLILGESGVGKDVVARFIHNISNREKGPFIRVNCGAIPETLMESELFGYEEGSFTGARRQGKPGMFELANGGTLFLDEVGELPIQMQAKLLHVLQDHKIMRVGGMKQVGVDVRVIAATNRELGKMVGEGKFRKDLYYRLNVILVEIPSLRERTEDIIPLAVKFLKKYNEKYNMKKRFSEDALRYLSRYNWPGNVRELENVTERLILTCPTSVIEIEHLRFFIKEENPSILRDFHLSSLRSLSQAKDELEKTIIAWALKQYGSTRKAAAALGVAQPTIVRLTQKYGIKKGEL